MSKEKACPSIEELSAWADNESDNNHKEHCAKCERCSEIVEDFRKMDSTMSKLFNSYEADSSLPDRIMEEIKKPTPVQFNWQRNILKIAAILAAALLISIFYKTDEKPSTAEINPDTVNDKEVVIVSSGNNEKEAISGDGIPPSLIPANEFTVISLDPEKASTSTDVIKDDVKHVWVSKNPQETLELLKRLAFNGVILSSTTSSTGKLELSISLTDKQLIKVVNRMSDEGNNLISRDFPQPNSATINAVGKIIQYKAIIIKKN
jgi:hypothetical protein